MRYLSKKLKFLASIKGKSEQKNEDGPTLSKDLSRHLKKNLETIQTLLKNSKDIVIREFCFGNQSQVHAALVFIDGMVNKSVINDNIVKPLIYDTHLINSQALHENDIKFIRRSLLAVGDVNEKTGFNELIASLLYGNAIFFVGRQ